MKPATKHAYKGKLGTTIERVMELQAAETSAAKLHEDTDGEHSGRAGGVAAGANAAVDSEQERSLRENKQAKETGALEKHDHQDDDDQYRLEFSAAQLRVKVQQARLETKIAADEQMLVLRKQIVDLEHQIQELQRSNAQAADRHQVLQNGVDVIMSDHKRTLNGMRDDLHVDKLVAALEAEKAARENLHSAYEKQNAALLGAQERVESLNAQVLKYQKTETVLAQSISHFQHRFDNKDQQRVASLERVKLELEEKHRDDTSSLLREVEIAKRAEQMAQEQLLAVEKECRLLQQSAQAAAAKQDRSGDAERELRAKIDQLETEKAVLVSKAEQLQRADGQLRSKVKTLDDELQKQRSQNALLREEVKELTKIASDLMEMAEKHQQEKRLRTGQRDEDDEFLAKRKKRLRMSIG